MLAGELTRNVSFSGRKSLIGKLVTCYCLGMHQETLADLTERDVVIFTGDKKHTKRANGVLEIR